MRKNFNRILLIITNQQQKKGFDYEEVKKVTSTEMEDVETDIIRSPVNRCYCYIHSDHGSTCSQYAS